RDRPVVLACAYVRDRAWDRRASEAADQRKSREAPRARDPCASPRVTPRRHQGDRYPLGVYRTSAYTDLRIAVGRRTIVPAIHRHLTGSISTPPAANSICQR